MAHPQEALESVAERARRALRDNEEANQQAQRGLRASDETEPQAHAQTHAQTHAQPQVQHYGKTYPQLERPRFDPEPLGSDRPAVGVAPDMIAERIQAIARVKELEPRLASSRLRAQELSQRLTDTATDSVHYADLLRWLAAVHAELRQLEAEYEAAQHVIRSSAWLMKMLADPT